MNQPNASDYALILFIILLLFLWLWALYALIRYWSVIPLWAKLIGIIGLVSYAVGGPVISLIVIYASRSHFFKSGVKTSKKSGGKTAFIF